MDHDTPVCGLNSGKKPCRLLIGKYMLRQISYDTSTVYGMSSMMIGT
jgi:hypothetical protein